ncbi:THAP domain-containing protein 5-like, partial [Aplysia californica]|uniref:THAP domain-containing protein 5-like n=1 Tax=Aplysia californica TaxID=6500 RepID=A0ABM1VQQ4_APLCA
MTSLPSTSRQDKLGGNQCCADGCQNARHGLPFFRFPRDEARCKIWIQNMGRLDLLEKPLSELGRKGYSLCCEHFESDQFDVPFERRHLKWNAVPTLFKVSLPIPPTQKRKSGSSPQKKFAKKLGLEKREDQADNGAHRLIGETMKSSSEEKNRLEGILVSSHDNDFQQSTLPNQHDPVVLLKRIAVPEEVNPTAGKKLVIPLAIKKEEDISCPPEMERETVVTAWRKSVQAQQALPSSSAEADVSVHASQVPAAGMEINVMGNHLLQESPAPQKQDSVAKYVRALEDISSGAEVTQEVAVQTPSGRKFKIYVVAVEEPDSSSPPPP